MYPVMLILDTTIVTENSNDQEDDNIYCLETNNSSNVLNMMKQDSNYPSHTLSHNSPYLARNLIDHQKKSKELPIENFCCIS